jgi:hypothetical protein
MRSNDGAAKLRMDIYLSQSSFSPGLRIHDLAIILCLQTRIHPISFASLLGTQLIVVKMTEA